MPGRSLWVLLLAVTATAVNAQTTSTLAGDQRYARTMQVLEQYNALSDMQLPIPEPDDAEEIVAGKVVKLRERMEMRSGATDKMDQRILVVGYRLIERPRLLVWLAALDVGTRHSDRLTEHLLSNDDQGGSLWYQHLHLYWPMRNRHWTIANRKTVEMAESTNGMVWEHAWRLAPKGREIAMGLLENRTIDGLTDNRARRAIYLPANRGAWTMFELDERLTLVASHATVELGGFIPDGFVASYVGRQLEKMLNGLVSRSDVMGSEYDTSYTVYTGAGEVITKRMAEDAMKLEKKRKAAAGH